MLQVAGEHCWGMLLELRPGSVIPLGTPWVCLHSCKKMKVTNSQLKQVILSKEAKTDSWNSEIHAESPVKQGNGKEMYLKVHRDLGDS